MGRFPRDVVVSPGFGAGFATWNGDLGYEIAEHPEVVDACRRRASTEEVRGLLDRLFPGADAYLGGWDQAVVQTVHGPYYIEEYDGSERVLTHQALRS